MAKQSKSPTKLKIRASLGLFNQISPIAIRKIRKRNAIIEAPKVECYVKL